MPQQEPEKKSTPAAQPIDMPDDEVLYELADLFRVFGDSTRIKILYALHDSELCVQDIANAVLFFASDMSSFVTGETMPVAGGFGLPSPMYAMYQDMKSKG